MKQEKELISIVDSVALPMFLRKVRASQALTQEEVADKAGIAKSTLARYERGQQAPSMLLLEYVANALGYDMRLVLTRRANK